MAKLSSFVQKHAQKPPTSPRRCLRRYGALLKEITMTENEVTIEKDEENERPIPSIWRSTFTRIIDAFVQKDYSLTCEIMGVSPVSSETANHIKEYIEDYGEELTQLPNETWDYSVCLWMGSHWDVLIDLWTVGEGRSDLVLGARVSEVENGYIIDIGMVYVP